MLKRKVEKEIQHKIQMESSIPIFKVVGLKLPMISSLISSFNEWK